MTKRLWADTMQEVGSLREAAFGAGRGSDPRDVLKALCALAEHPCAYHEVDLGEVWVEIAERHRQLQEYDAAIEAMERAVEVGYRCQPLPQCEVAEFHLLAGRREECDRLYSEVRDRTPEDVWLYNHAGLSYQQVGDHEEALRWLAEGIELAMRTGDPEELVPELAEIRDASLAAVSIDPETDPLRDRVEEFVDCWTPGAERPPFDWGPRVDDDRPCTNCDYTPERRDEPFSAARRDDPVVLDLVSRPPVPKVTPVAVALAWFPADEWKRAIELWPELDEYEGDHQAYSRRIECVARATRDNALPRVPPSIAPIDVDQYLAWCEEEDLDSAESPSRAGYAADLARTGQGMPWPPGRNDPCWCGSGRKYKRCCDLAVPSD